MFRTNIIQYFIDSRNFQSYLEIGVFNGDNFRKVRCAKKEGVDPASKYPINYNMTSDDFFKQNKEKFDIVFIDGLHLCEQVYKDIKNSVNCLNPNGVIVLHDILPIKEIEQRRDRVTTRWNGDCWKAFLKYKYESPYLCYVMHYDEGCGVIDTAYPTNNETRDFDMNSLNYDFYQQNLHLFDARDFMLDSIDQYNKSGHKLDIWTVNVDTSKLTNAMIRSIVKNFKSIQYNSINVFDNSIKHPFVLDDDIICRCPVNIIDNTNQQLINFYTAYLLCSNVNHSLYKNDTHNGSPLGSFRHSVTIRYILGQSKNDVLLLDSDCILYRDIDFINPYFITAGGIDKMRKRIHPCIQYFNIEMYNKFNLQYTSETRPCFPLGNEQLKDGWDTGGFFYKSLIDRSIPFFNIQYLSYVHHLGAGSHINGTSITLEKMNDTNKNGLIRRQDAFLNTYKNDYI